MAAAGAQGYARCAEGELLWRELDGLALVYHRPSGQTHMLASPLPEIMAALTDKPQPHTALLTLLSEAYDLADDDDGLAALSTHLEELTALGLIRSAPCATR